MAIISNEKDLATITRSGQILGDALRAVRAQVAPGVTTQELDDVAREYIRQAGGEPSFLGYQGYPASLCVSINDEVVHGIPGPHIIRDGDVVSLDLGVAYDGWLTDSAVTVVVGTVSPEVQKLVAATEAALDAAVQAAVVGGHIGDIGAAVERIIRPLKFGIVDQLCGHGVGREVHEPPQIPNIGRVGTGPKISAGAILAIEPMIVLGRPGVYTKDDEWTVVTNDGSIAAHFEHTVVVLPEGPKIVTI